MVEDDIMVGWLHLVCYAGHSTYWEAVHYLFILFLSKTLYWFLTENPCIELPKNNNNTS